MGATDAPTDGVFKDLSVTPTFSSHQATLLWSVAPGWNVATFTIQKSPDGINDWMTIGKVSARLWFLDPNLFPKDRSDEPFYRVFARHPDGSKSWSPAIGAFTRLTRIEFGVAHKILLVEARMLRTRTKASILKMNPAAELCPSCNDTTTGQRLTTSFCGVCNGTGKLNAYFPGISSFVWFLSPSSGSRDYNETGAGSKDEQVQKARMLAVPPLDKEDMVVETAIDRRWLVEEISIGMFNGKVPVTCDLTLRQLARTDARNKVPANGKS